MQKRIYLDNCCYNRPYDDQSQMRVHLETEAKLYIQKLIRQGKVELVTSYVLEFENSRNKFTQKKIVIQNFMDDYAVVYISSKNKREIKKLAEEIMQTGVKEKDAYHVSCAILGQCEYFITTDDRLLKFQSEKIELVTPGEFIRKLEEDE